MTAGRGLYGGARLNGYCLWAQGYNQDTGRRLMVESRGDSEMTQRISDLSSYDQVQVMQGCRATLVQLIPTLPLPSQAAS